MPVLVLFMFLVEEMFNMLTTYEVIADVFGNEAAFFFLVKGKVNILYYNFCCLYSFFFCLRKICCISLMMALIKNQQVKII